MIKNGQLSQEEISPNIRIRLDNGPLMEFDAEVSEALSSVAIRNNMSYAQAMGVAAMNQALLEREVDNGSQLLLKRGSKFFHLEYV